MANLMIPTLYGWEMGDEFVGGLILQLHLTVKCDQNCMHCYMYNDPSYIKQLKNPMNMGELKRLIRESYEFVNKYESNITYAITGGDPILSENFWQILSYINETCEEAKIIIMGNSYHINEEIAWRLFRNGVSQYQISLDGQKEVHDMVRKKGSYEDAHRALKILHYSGILATVMFTLSEENVEDMIPLIHQLDKLEYIDGFAFDRIVPIGNGKKIKEEVIRKEKLKNIFFELFKDEMFNRKKLFEGRKDNLWKLFYDDMGLLMPYDEKKNIVNGCVAGTSAIAVLADGTMMACRRMNIPIGDFRKDTFSNIFINNKVSRQVVKLDSKEECNFCSLLAYCRGCAAQSYAIKGDINKRDPGCWRE